jgi:hypothetical protein
LKKEIESHQIVGWMLVFVVIWLVIWGNDNQTGYLFLAMNAKKASLCLSFLSRQAKVELNCCYGNEHD